MSEQFSILLGNHSRLEAGQTDGAWLPMPATTEQLHEAMRNIGVTAENPQDLFVGGFANTEQCPFDVPLSVIQSGSIDELNYLGKLLEMQRDEDKAKFAAAVTLGEYAGNLKDLINLAQNLDCYWIYPTVQSEEDYGYYLIDELDELELPEEAKRYFMYEEYGRDAAINDGGRFTEQGYIYNNKNTFAIPAEQPEKVNPLKHIEDTVEQNDNAFDGLINNTPQTATAGELEQKAKAGEPISLADYAAAIKAEKERGSAKQEKPSIRAQLRAEKERAAQKKTVKAKNHELEV